MAPPAGKLAYRLRVKTPAANLQASLPQPLDLEGGLGKEGGADTKRRAYLVTLPHPQEETASTGERLVAPGTKTKEEIMACFRDACAHPVSLNQYFAGGRVEIELASVRREFHALGPQQERRTHDHIPVLGKVRFRYLPVKRALLQRHGLASHWSVSHDGLWSCVRYVHFPTPRSHLQVLS